MNQRIIYLFLKLSFLSLSVEAQNIEAICKPDIIHFSNQVYNAHRQNWGIAQDSLSKFMYFANSNGLLEYDGNKWEVYSLPQKQKVRSVFVDAHHQVFTGALGEFGYWIPNEKGNLSYHSLKHLIGDPNFKNEEIWNIIPTSQGILFQSFAYIYIYQNKQVIKLPTPGNVLFVQEVNHRLFLEVIGKGLYELQGKTFRFMQGSEFLGKESVYCILPNKQATNVLVGTNKGLYLFNGATFQEFNKITNEFIQQNQLNRGIALDENHYAFGTILNGIIITDTNGNIIQHINQKNGLQNNTVLSLRKDDDGNLWVGMDKGIDLILLSSLINYYNDFDGNLGTVYDAVLHQGLLYLGTNHGLFVTSLSSNEANFQLVPLTQGQVWDLKIFDKQLLCGHNNGTFLIEGKKATLISNITGGWVIKALRNKQNTLLQGTYTQLCIYKKGKNGKWKLDHVIPNFVNPVRQLEEDNEGNIWVNKASNGLEKLQLSNDLGKVTNRVIFDSSEFHGASVNLCALNNQILVTTNKGIMAYNQAVKRFVLAQEIQHSLGNDIAYKLFPILENNEAFVWKADGGLGIFSPNNSVREIPIKINQWVDDLNILSVDANNFLLCTDKGFALFPKNTIHNLAKSIGRNPLIRSISVSDFPELNQTFVGKDPLPNLSFEHDQNTIIINFTTTNYANQVKYSFWLENSTKKWSPFQPISQKEFDNLPEGKYIFHLKSNVSNTEVHLVFDILAPWYWNIWSKLFYLLIVLGLGYWLYIFQLKRWQFQQERIRRKLEKKLKRQQEQSESELIQVQNQQLEHDILRKSEELANSTMVLIRKNELLLEIKQEVNKLQKENTNNRTASYKQMLNLIESNISTAQDWVLFESNFNKVHDEFLKKLIENFPNLSPGDLKLAAYLRMNLSTKEIAQLLNITPRSVELKRYRLRKKIFLDSEANLGEFMIAY